MKKNERKGQGLDEKVNWRRLLRRKRPANGERSKNGGKGSGVMKRVYSNLPFSENMRGGATRNPPV